MPAKPIVRDIADVAVQAVDGCPGVTMQVLLGADDAMPNFYTRLFTMAPGGHIRGHRHDIIEHEQVVLEGEIVLTLDGVETTARAGQTVYIPAGVAHAYDNRGEVPARFLCAIPRGEYQTEWTE